MSASTSAIQASIDDLMAPPHTLTEVQDDAERAATVFCLAQTAKAAGHELIVVSPYGADAQIREMADVIATSTESAIETLTTLAVAQVEECFHPGNPVTIILTDLDFLENGRDAEATYAVQTAVNMFLMRGHENGFRLRLVK